MNIARGYQAMATVSTGSVFVIGASWNGGQGGKNGELYSPTANTWSLLSGAPVAPMLTADAQGTYLYSILGNPWNEAHINRRQQVSTAPIITVGYSAGRTAMSSRVAHLKL